MKRICLLMAIGAIIIGCSKSSERTIEPSSGPVPAKDSTTVDSSTVQVSTQTTRSSMQLVPYEFPPEATKSPKAVYPEKLKKTGLQGSVLVEIEVKEDGSVGEAKVIRSLMAGPGGLDEVALQTIKQWHFTPALKQNKPIACKITIPIPFFIN